jgi:hypothetical protein
MYDSMRGWRRSGCLFEGLSNFGELVLHGEWSGFLGFVGLVLFGDGYLFSFFVGAIF